MRTLQRGLCLLVLLVGATVVPASAADPTGSPVSGDLPPLTDMPFYRADPARTAIQPGPGPAAAPDLAWQHPLSSASHFLPILVDGALIGGTNDGLVVAVDAHTGAERWRFRASGPVGGSAGAANGLVYFGDTHSLFALDVKTGAQRWAVEAPSAETLPLVVDGVVYTAAIGGVLGFDAATGEQVWHWAGPQVPVSVGAIHDGVLYAIAGDGRVYAIDMRSSTEKWHVQTIGPNPGYPEVVGDTVYVSTVQGDLSEPVGELYAIDRETGAVRWRFRTPTGQQISAGPVRDGIIYANSEFDGIYALRDDGDSASVVWHVDAPRGYWPSMMVGDVLYQQRRGGSIGAYALADGALKWETPTVDIDAGGPLVSGGMVFQMRDDGSFAGYATPDLIALLPEPAAEPTPSPTALVGQGPFTQVGAFSWADTGLATPLGMDTGPDGLLYIVDTKPSVVVVDPKTGAVVRTWGRAGSGPGEFDVARHDDNPGNGDISVGTDGTVYVADGSNHRVQAFKADGTYLSQFGSFGAGPGQFGNLQEIEVGPDGSVYVMDDLDEPLSKFTPDGKFVWRMARSASEPDGTVIPHGLAIRSDGSILLSCEDCHHILVLDPASGQIIQRMPDAKELVSGGLINLDQVDRMYVSQFFPVSEIVLDPTGGFLDGLYHHDDSAETYLGSPILYGDVFWPSPVFLPDGRAFSFGRDGLIELKASLPS